MANVTLIAHTPDPERMIACAAKLCYSGSDIGSLYDGLTDEKAAEFVDMLSELGHESPIEHISFTFGIEGVSRAFLAQITRHRIASYSVQSQRYVKKKDFEYIGPPEIKEHKEALEIYESAMKQAAEAYDKLAEILESRHRKALMEQGMDEKSAGRAAGKAAIEDARFVLPNACDTKMIVTMNARSLLNFFRHRLCNRAQWEIRDVALQMYNLVYETAPGVFSKAGPSCLFGPCGEGKMTCGKIKEVRANFEAIRKGL